MFSSSVVQKEKDHLFFFLETFNKISVSCHELHGFGLQFSDLKIWELLRALGTAASRLEAIIMPQNTYTESHYKHYGYHLDSHEKKRKKEGQEAHEHPKKAKRCLVWKLSSTINSSMLRKYKWKRQSRCIKEKDQMKGCWRVHKEQYLHVYWTERDSPEPND